MKIFLVLFTAFIITLLSGCGDDPVSDPTVNLISDLTRTGKFISFSSNKDGDYDIYLAEVDRSGALLTTGFTYPTNPHNLTNNNVNDRTSAWSPNGRILVYSSVTGNGRELHAFFFDVNGRPDTTAGVNPRLIVSSSGSWDESPSFSVDGRYLVWDRRSDDNSPPGVDTSDSRDIYIGEILDSGINFSVSNIHPIKSTVGEDEYNPEWSVKKNLNRIAYEFRSSATSEDNDVYTMDPFDATSSAVFYNPGRSGYPVWAPSNQYIIFEADQGNGGFYKIVFQYYPPNNSITDVQRISGVNLRQPAHVPNGNYIAYVRYNTSGSADLYRMIFEPPYNQSGIKVLPAEFDGFINIEPAW